MICTKLPSFNFNCSAAISTKCDYEMQCTKLPNFSFNRSAAIPTKSIFSSILMQYTKLPNFSFNRNVQINRSAAIPQKCDFSKKNHCTKLPNYNFNRSGAIPTKMRIFYNIIGLTLLFWHFLENQGIVCRSVATATIAGTGVYKGSHNVSAFS